MKCVTKRTDALFSMHGQRVHVARPQFTCTGWMPLTRPFGFREVYFLKSRHFPEPGQGADVAKTAQELEASAQLATARCGKWKRHDATWYER